MTRDELIRKRTAELRRAIASDTLSQAIGRGRDMFTAPAFTRLVDALHANPANADEWDAACAEWTVYGALLREKAGGRFRPCHATDRRETDEGSKGQMTPTEVIARELGPAPKLFARFRSRPMGSGHQSTVHAATLHDGRKVAVKVLKPEMRARTDAFLADLKQRAKLAETAPGVDRDRLRAELAATARAVNAELDCRLQAQSAAALRANWPDDQLHIPEVIDSHTSRSVMTMSRVVGTWLTCPAELPPDTAQQLVRVFYESVFRDGLFHASLHPSNVADVGGRLAFVDFGKVYRLSDVERVTVAEIVTGFLELDGKRIVRAYRRAGWSQAETCPARLILPAFNRTDQERAEQVNGFGKVFRRLHHELAQVDSPSAVFRLCRAMHRVEETSGRLQPEIDTMPIVLPIVVEALS